MALSIEKDEKNIKVRSGLYELRPLSKIASFCAAVFFVLHKEEIGNYFASLYLRRAVGMEKAGL